MTPLTFTEQKEFNAFIRKVKIMNLESQIDALEEDTTTIAEELEQLLVELGISE